MLDERSLVRNVVVHQREFSDLSELDFLEETFSNVSIDYSGTLGCLLTVDAYNCENCPSDSELIQHWCQQAVATAGLKPVGNVVSTFPVPGTDLTGVSVITITINLEQSHLAVHTWPEYNAVAIDLFTCSDYKKIPRVIEYLIEFFQPEKTNIAVRPRCKLQ